MRATQLERSEIDVEFRFQLLAIPRVSAKELFVVLTALVPVCQQRAGEIEPFAIPALRNHVNLPADLLLINLMRILRIRDVEHAALAIAEAIDEQRLIVCADADVHR